MDKQLRGFVDFVRTHGVVGLAVGLAIGTQVGKAVESIVTGLITPFVGFILGSSSRLEQAVWNIAGRDTGRTDYWFTLGERQLVIGWGAVLSALLVLLAVAAVIYYVVMGLRLDRLDKKKE